ncbi:hypothetical protein [Nitrosarchaeum sp. AC2]|uniref:hypothetical protein n=1 Tax=Nitrosarchaeum sp. AC2 TaxID=2259673 RepID=UPI0015CA9F35|nr:hypothetical protein [Nitrosarchaeum sp. AC2]QLH11290.1 hypothetical protein DSQ20_07300 [Nitrosarchaeum sp. AC2]
MADTRVKLSFPDGTSIEIEGTEIFVEKHWAELKTHIVSASQNHNVPNRPNKIKDTNKNAIKSKKKSAVSPIPINLKGDGKKQSLKEFYKEKNPNTNQEIITVFAYYLNKFCDIPNMEYGHALSCYIEVGIRKPTNFESLYNNIRARTGYIETGETRYSAKISISGENFVEHDLPKQVNKK